MDSRKESWFRKPEFDAIRNGCDVIIQKDIDSVRKPTLYKNNNSWLNDELHMALTSCLEHSMRRSNFKYGETGYVVRTDFKMICIPVDGNYKEVKLINGELVQHLISLGVDFGSLICVHNHPNNSLFSYRDIANFLHYDAISAIAVVGNTHNVYVLRKCIEMNAMYDYDSILSLMSRERIALIRKGIHMNTAESKVVNMIIMSAQKFNLEFTHYKRGGK